MMRYKTLFRLLCKLLGLYTLVLSVSSVIQLASVLTIALFSESTSSPFISRWSVEYLGPQVSSTVWELAAGLYLFFRGEWIVNLAIPSNRAYCANCGYEMSGAPTPICPECGVHQQTGSPSH